jgi:hypothetical protein
MGPVMANLESTSLPKKSPQDFSDSGGRYSPHWRGEGSVVREVPVRDTRGHPKVFDGLFMAICKPLIEPTVPVRGNLQLPESADKTEKAVQ